MAQHTPGSLSNGQPNLVKKKKKKTEKRAGEEK